MTTRTNYGVDYSGLPDHIREGFRGYIEDRTPPGGLVRACLENSLVGAFGAADEINRRRMFDIANFLYNEAPSPCWGSREKVKAWLHGEKHEAEAR